MGEIHFVRTEFYVTETWDFEWNDSFAGYYTYSLEEAGLITEDGPVGAYTQSDTSDETYSYTGTYDDDWVHAEEEGSGGEGGGEGENNITTDPDAVSSGNSSSTFTETAAFHWQSEYHESGAFGPGGNLGVYESSDSMTLDYDCSGSGDSLITYENGSVNEQHWTFSGEDDYGLSVADAGNFDLDGDHALGF